MTVARRDICFEVTRTIPAILELAENISLELRRALDMYCRPVDLFAAELLFREAITNAVLHGCRLDPARQIIVAMRVRTDRVVIDVTDDGPGFDWRRNLRHTARDCDVSGRGLAIYRAYANRIRFNTSGNRLTLVRSFSREEKRDE